jgi:CHAT domain-containing protein
MVDGPGGLANHVALAACVSGLGRPAATGDMLGLEFGLRLKGAATVIASHWNVDVDVAAAFYARYYRAWLGQGMSRAGAWRHAVLEAIAEIDGSAWARCVVCAFSVFGDWR